MFGSRLFWKLLLTFTALALCCIAALGYTSHQRQRADAVRDAAGALSEAVDFLQVAIAASEERGPDGLRRLAKEVTAVTGDRFTLLDQAGVAIADTDDDKQGVNLAQRPEVIAALAGEPGTDQRRDPQTGVRSLYVATPVVDAAPVVVVRGMRSLAAADAQLTQSLGINALSGAAALLLFVLVTTGVLRRVVLPVLALNKTADAIVRGNYRQQAYVSNNDELGLLAQSLNRMSQELGSQLMELRESGQRQATVLGGMIEGVVAVDEREHVLFANAAAGKLFGFISPQIEGRPLLEVVRHHTLHESVVAGLNSGRPQRLEIEWEAPDAKTLLVQVTPLPGEPCPGVVVVLHDTTELRRLENLRQEFVANVSHELKTPLSSIKAYTETLLGGALNDAENNVGFLRRIEEQADRLNNLIQDLLALARIESAQQAFEIKPVSLSELVESCLSDYRTQAAAKQIELLAEPHEPSLWVIADPEGLRVIFNNLIDNAIKYTPQGGQVSVRWRLAGSDRALIDVADTGIGIPANELPRVFERFYRVDKARSRDLGGTGLGLAIVKHLCHAFGGSVSVASTEREGTTFTLELPAQ